MTTWILLTLIAQFIGAIVALIDKYIVSSNRAGDPISYASIVGISAIFSLLVFLLNFIPGISGLPSISNINPLDLVTAMTALIAAGAFLIGIISVFNALKRADASDVIPVVGSTTAITTLLFSFLFLNQDSLSQNFLIGFIVIVAGTFLVSLFRFDARALYFSLVSGFFFGIQAVAIKKLFLVTNFDSGFLWLNISIPLLAVILLFIPHSGEDSHKETREHIKKTSISTYSIIALKQFISGVSAFLILKAIEIGDVSIVQALGGLQFVFILIFAVVFGNITHHYCGENCNFFQKFQKIISTVIIVFGFIILFL